MEQYFEVDYKALFEKARIEIRKAQMDVVLMIFGGRNDD